MDKIIIDELDYIPNIEFKKLIKIKNGLIIEGHTPKEPIRGLYGNKNTKNNR